MVCIWEIYRIRVLFKKFLISFPNFLKVLVKWKAPILSFCKRVASNTKIVKIYFNTDTTNLNLYASQPTYGTELQRIYSEELRGGDYDITWLIRK